MNNSNETADIIRIPSVDVLYGSVSLCSCFFGSVANLLSVRYFARNHRKVSNNVYLWMGAFDFLTCFSMIHFGLSRLNPAVGADILGNGFWCNLFGFTYNISSRLSVFIVAVQSILRSYCLVYPFRKLKLKVPILILSTMALVQIFQASLPYLRSKRYRYNTMWTTCLWYLDDIISPTSPLYSVLYIFTLILPFLLPALPVLVSCGVSIKYIRAAYPTQLTISRNPKITQLACYFKSNIKRRASITVVIITVVYIVFNMPYWIYLIFNMVLNEPLGGSYFNTYFGILLNPLCVIFNAAINPIIYFLRIADMKSQVLLPFKNIEFPRSLRPTKTQKIVHSHCNVEAINFDTPVFGLL